MTNADSQTLHGFRAVQKQLSVILNNLAQVADGRGDLIVGGRNLKDRLVEDSPASKRTLAEILRERANNVLEKTAFKLAVVGEFNSGKSTLINALLGREVLSVSWKPTTATQIRLNYGKPEGFQVKYFADPGSNQTMVFHKTTDLFQELAPFTSDPALTDDEGLLHGTQRSLAQQVKEVVVWCDVPFLKERGLELIDTPGLGSVFAAHKTVTYTLIPRVDATLFLFAMNPGIGETDIAYLQFLREYIGQMLFVMTKIDTGETAEQVLVRAEYSRETIRSKTNLPIDRVYPISAQLVLEGDNEKSGFPEFLQALEALLIKSGGAVRLEMPLAIANAYWLYLKNAIANDIQIANQDLKSLQTELARLNKEMDFVKQKKKSLLEHVTEVIEDTITNTAERLQLLPAIVQREVEHNLEHYSSKQLLNADKLLAIVVKETVTKWLINEEELFKVKATKLQQRTENDMRNILESIQNPVLLPHREPSDRITEQIESIFSKSAAQFLQTSLLKSGGSFITGWGVNTLISALIGLITGTFAFAVIPILQATQGLSAEAGNFDKQLRNNLRQELLKLIPGNSVNVYTALVEGYTDNIGVFVEGLRPSVQHSYTQLGEELQTYIEEIITNNLDSYLTQLHNRISNEEGGQWNKAQSLSGYKQQDDALQEIEAQILRVKDIMERLVQSDTEQANK